VKLHHRVAKLVKLTGCDMVSGVGLKAGVPFRRLISSCMLAAIASIPCVAAEKPAKPATVDDVVVKRLDLQMPADDPTKKDVLGQPPREKFLWTHFFNEKDEPSFDSITTKDWRPVAKNFRASLVAKAKKLNLPAEALDKALQAIEVSPLNEKLAVIPVGAYLIRDGIQDAWAVACNWEHDVPGVKVAEIPAKDHGTRSETRAQALQLLTIEHRRVFVFSVADNNLFEFTTCD
jgi:hypothetical protein